MVKNKFLKLLLSFLILLIISLLIKSISFAEELSIKDIVISGDISEIRVSSFLKGNLDSDILETIKSGIPTTFTYYIELYKKHSGVLGKDHYIKIGWRIVEEWKGRRFNLPDKE